MSKTKTQMNLLPVVLLVVLIIGAGYLLLRGEVQFPNLSNSEPKVRRLNGFPTVIYSSDVIEKQRLVIKNEQELQNFLQTVDKTGILQLQEKIDFNKEYLLGVATETEEMTGSSIKIRKVYEDKESKKLLVSIRQVILGEGCEDVEKDPNTAIDLVAINKTDWTIDFELVKEKRDCQTESEESTDSVQAE